MSRTLRHRKRASAVIIDELFILLGVKGDGSLKKTENALTRITDSAKQLGVAFGVGFVAHGFARFVDEQRKVGDQLDKTSKKLGVTTDDLQKLRHAGKLAGVGSDEITKSLAALQKQARDASLGSQSTIMAFSRLGVSVRGAGGGLKSATSLFREAVGGLHRLGNATERSAIAQQIFGDTGLLLATNFGQGEKSLESLEKEMARFGGGFSQRAIAASAKLTDTMTRWELASRSLKGVLAESLLPIVDRVLKITIELVNGFRQLIEGTHALEVAAGLLGAALLRMLLPFAPAVAMILVVGVAIAGLVVLIDGLVAAFKSGEDGLVRLVLALKDLKDAATVDYRNSPLLFFFQQLARAIEAVLRLIPGLAPLVSFVEFMAGKDVRKLLDFGDLGTASPVAAAAAAGGVSVQQGGVQIQNTINIDGAKDPVAVGGEVAEQVRLLNEQARAEAYRNLVPVGGT